MNADQCRMARAALHWTFDDLAERAGLGKATVRRFEAEGTDARTSTAAKIRDAFEAAGVTFLDDDGNGPGVRLKPGS